MPSPNTVHIGGPMTKIEDHPCGATPVTPGMIVEMFKHDSGTIRWRPHSSATATPSRYVALEKLGKGIDDAYAEDDLMLVAAYGVGGLFYGLVPSGQTLTYGLGMQSNGDGLLKQATATTADAGVEIYKSKEDLGAITVTTRLITEVIK